MCITLLLYTFYLYTVYTKKQNVITEHRIRFLKLIQNVHLYYLLTLVGLATLS